MDWIFVQFQPIHQEDMEKMNVTEQHFKHTSKIKKAAKMLVKAGKFIYFYVM